MLLHLFIAALWSPAGKRLTSWLLLVIFIVFLLLLHVVFWVRCGTRLYPFLIFAVCLYDLILYVPSTIFQLYRDGSSWVEPVLSLDLCSCSRTQRSDAGEARTRGPSVSSQALDHYATALPLIFAVLLTFIVFASITCNLKCL